MGAILLAEIGDIGWFTKFSQLRKLAWPRHRAGPVRAVRRAGADLEEWPEPPPLGAYHAAIGAARTVAGRARLATLKAKRRGERFAGFKAVVELAAKQLRVIWAVWRSETPYDPRRAGGLQRQAR